MRPKRRRSIRPKPEPANLLDRHPSEPGFGPRARPYPVLLPEGEYLAACVSAFGPYRSRAYGEKTYLTFQIVEGAHAGTKLPAYFRPSSYPTSRWYRMWSIANDAPPSRNCKLSARKFLGKGFRVLVQTVRPRHRITQPDGKLVAGPELPEFLQYSKVAAILALEVTNGPPRLLTDFSSKPFPRSEFTEGEGGGGKVETGSEGRNNGFQGCNEDGSPVTNPTQADGGIKSAVSRSPSSKRNI